MSAASVGTPITTTYIQSPARFQRPGKETRPPKFSLEPGSGYTRPGPVSNYQKPSQFGVKTWEGLVPKVIDTEENPISLKTLVNPYTEQAEALSPTRQFRSTQPLPSTTTSPSPAKNSAPSITGIKGPRSNPNNRVSAGFPLGVTPKEAAERARRQAEERAEWEARQEEYFERARQQEEKEAEERRQEQARQHALIYGTPAPTSPSATQSLRPISSSASPSSTLSRIEAAERTAKEQAAAWRPVRDSKIGFRDRVPPPKPDFPEDPLTAGATEHTGNYPGPVLPKRPFEPSDPSTRDTEAIAPAGSKEREAQKLRVNPLLNPNFIVKSDAAGLGYGRTHRDHFRYISHWQTPEIYQQMSYELRKQSDSRSGYQSKSDLGYRPEVAGLGYGHPHNNYNWNISVRRADDVLKDYPNRETCEKFLRGRMTSY